MLRSSELAVFFGVFASFAPFFSLADGSEVSCLRLLAFFCRCCIRLNDIVHKRHNSLPFTYEKDQE